MARTQGTFHNVYEAARKFMIDGYGKPHDPVVRLNGITWMLESGMNSADWCTFEVGLDDFTSYWWEGLNDIEFIPSQSDIDNFVNGHNPRDSYGS